MAKKSTTTLLLIAAAAGAAWFFMRKKTTDSAATEIPESADTGSDTTKADAVVTAPPGKIQEALNTAKDITSNLKDVAVLVKSGNKTALVTKGKKKKKHVKCPKLTEEQLNNLCGDLTGKARKACRRKHRRSCVIIPPTQSSLTPFPESTASND